MQMHYSHAMSSRRIEQIVGAFIVIPLLGLIVVGIFMAKAEHLFDEKYLLQTSLSKSYGLEPGAPVLMSGITIGKVKQVEFNQRGTIDVVLQLLGRYRDKVREDSVLSIEKSGLVVGQTQVVIAMGSPNAPVLSDGAVIKSVEPREIAELVSDVAPALEAVKRTLLRVDAITASVEKAAADLPVVIASIRQSVGSVEQTAATLPQLTGSVEKAVSGLPAVMASVQRTVGAVEQTAATLPQLSGSVEKAVSGLPAVMGSVQRVVGSVEQTAVVLPEIAGSVKNTLSAVDGIVANTRSAAAALPALMEAAKEATTNVKASTEVIKDVSRDLSTLARTAGSTLSDLNTIMRGAKKTFPISTFWKNAGPEIPSSSETGRLSLRGDQLRQREMKP